MISGAPASYWLDLRGYDPPSAATRVKPPMLILQGERDYQVTPEEFAKWKAALGSRRDVTFRSYPALNHLFIAGTGPSLPAEYQGPGPRRGGRHPRHRDLDPRHALIIEKRGRRRFLQHGSDPFAGGGPRDRFALPVPIGHAVRRAPATA